MKFRKDFVTNSSSSSFIICFARISDLDKASKILEKFNIQENIYTDDEVRDKMHWGTLGADWAGAEIFGVERILDKYPNDKYLIISECLEAEYDDDGYPTYSYDFELNNIIPSITEENGFTNVDVAEGEGRDG